MPTVTIKDVGTTECADGDRLVLAIEHAGCDILHRCGGNARCATCKVLILAGDAGPMTDAERERLDRIADRPDNLRLSCQVQVRDDLTVDVLGRLKDHPDMGDPGPEPKPWPADHALPPE